MPVTQNCEAVSASSENTNSDTYKLERTSDDCQTDQRRIKQSDNAEKQKESDSAVSSQSQDNGTTASAAFYFRPGTNCYESFGTVVKNAKKTSKLAACN